AFGSLDGKLSRLFFFIIAPEDKDSEFLNIMAEVGQFLSKKETIDKLLLAKTNSELYSTLILLLENYSSHSE
ncbi:MAG: PTS sugar transporter subunit IIA, partial [Candidatus Hydrogenedentes bacterium]|nr:PTS sugar transporter subunit IIA [Candidatus Hydrogenedentota bacterium]